MKIEIHRISEDGFEESIEVIRNAFSTVAKTFNLTRENAPTNGAFIEIQELRKMKEKDIDMFGIYENNICVGFVAVEKIDERAYCIEKLAVLPEYRHKGYGKMLMDHCFEIVKEYEGEKVVIGIINENQILKNWYLNYGFLETGTRSFKHLPFEACFMEKMLCK